MTFIVPNGESERTLDGASRGLGLAWSAWTPGFAVDDMSKAYATYLETNQAIWEASMQMLFFPFRSPAESDAVETAALVEPASVGSEARSEDAAIAEAEIVEIVAVKAAAEPTRAPAPIMAANDIVPAATSDDAVEAAAPKLLSKPDGAPDDLIMIKGIGPKLNQLLNSLGVWHFRQIVSWTPAEVAWVNAKIDFKGRIQRERWQPQAAELMKANKAA